MPSRSDIYKIARKLLLAAGIQTVYRGYFYPDLDSQIAAGLVYPLAGVAEHESERITPGEPYWFKCEGTLLIQIWLNTGDVFGSAGDTAWNQMDDMHDAILQSFGQYYAGDGGPTSQTTTFKPRSFDPMFWYRNLPYLGADLRVDYVMNFA